MTVRARVAVSDANDVEGVILSQAGWLLVGACDDVM